MIYFFKLPVNRFLDINTPMKNHIVNLRTASFTKLFHHLVNNERKCSNGTTELEVKDKMYYGPDQIAHGFREHFLELLSPNKNNNYDEQYHVICRSTAYRRNN